MRPRPRRGFLFIRDITNTATGVTLVILIVLYVGHPARLDAADVGADDGQAAEDLMMLLPLFFVFFIIRFPAGLIVYWITTNTWTMAQQYVFKRRIGHSLPPPAAGTPALATSGGGGGGRNGRDGNGNGTAAATGGIAGLLRARTKPDAGRRRATGEGRRRLVIELEWVLEGRRGLQGQRQPAASARSKPPPSPRKKKKRSGRRR